MKDLIDRQALAEKKFQPSECRGLGEGAAYRQGWNDAIDAIIDNEPSVEAEPVRHGHWVYGEDEDGVDGYRCNKCGFFVTWDYEHSHIHFIDDYFFCPHCNARMDEVEQDG